MPRVSIPRPDFSTLAAAAFVGALAIFLVWSGFKGLQADTYRLLYSGRWIAQHGVPHHDVFTIAAQGRPFADQQWLAELTDYEAWRVAGYNGLALLAALAFGSGFALLAALMRRRGASVAVAITCSALAIFGTFGVTFIRAQLFAIPLFVLLLWLCLADSEQHRLRWRLALVLPLLALWANMHGSVLLGAGLVAAYLTYRALGTARGRRWRPALGYAGLALVAALTPLATPYGIHVLAYYREMLGNHAIAVADIEWAPPALGSVPFYEFVIPLVVASASVMAATVKGYRPSWPLLGATALTGIAGWWAMRNNLWFGIVAALLVAETASAWLPTAAAKPAFVGALSLGTTTLLVLGVGPLLTRSARGFESQAPLGAIAAVASYASSHPCARIMADNTSASALLWLDPDSTGRVGFDGELEVYTQVSLTQWSYFQAVHGKRWLTVARGYQLLLGASEFLPKLVHRLGRLPGGHVLALDARGIAVLNPAAADVSGCSSTPGVLRARVKPRPTKALLAGVSEFAPAVHHG